MGDRVENVMGHDRRRSGSIDESALPGSAGRRAARRHSRQSTYSEQQLEQLNRIGSDFRLQRDLQRALAELSAREEEYREAIEIQTRLEAENDDLLTQIDQLSQTLSDQIMDIKVLQQKCSTLEELYNDEHERYEAEIKDKEDQINTMEAELFQKDGEIEEIVQELESHQSKVHDTVTDVLRQSSTESTVVTLAEDAGQAGGSKQNGAQLELSTDLEKELYERLLDERQKTKEGNRKFERLLAKMEGAQRLEVENDVLRSELEELRTAQNDDIEQANRTNKAISDEIVAVARRNAALQQELDDMQGLIEDKEYQIRMLEAELEMDRGETNRDLGGVGSLGDDLVQALQAEHQDMLAQQSAAAAQPRLSAAKMGSMGFEAPEPEQKKEDDVPDVLKEYLHLTASAVKIKFPQVTEITSEQLIEKVQKLSFFQYHDAMVRLMKHEEAKMKQREQEKIVQRQKEVELEKAQNTSVLGRIAAFFTNSGEEEIQKQANSDFQGVSDVSPVVSRTHHRVKKS